MGQGGGGGGIGGGAADIRTGGRAAAAAQLSLPPASGCPHRALPANPAARRRAPTDELSRWQKTSAPSTARPAARAASPDFWREDGSPSPRPSPTRSEEHTSELQ